MIDYTKESKLNVKSAFEKLQKDLMDNKWGCNPGLAYKGLTINKQAGMIIPCKIVVYSDKGKTKVSLYRPTVALGTAGSLRGYDKISVLAVEAEDELKKIIDMQ